MLPSFLPYLLLYSPTYLLLKVRYNEAADTYSFGLLLWELAHRQTVFAEHTGVQVASPRSTGARDRSPPISNPSKSPPSTGCRGARVHPPSESRYTSRSAGSPFHRHRSAGSFPSKEPNRRSTSPPPAPGRLVQASLRGFAIRGHNTSVSIRIHICAGGHEDRALRPAPLAAAARRARGPQPAHTGVLARSAVENNVA